MNHPNEKQNLGALSSLSNPFGPSSREESTLEILQQVIDISYWIFIVIVNNEKTLF